MFFHKKQETRTLRFAELSDIKKRRQRFLKLIALLLLCGAVAAALLYLRAALRIKYVDCRQGGEICEKGLAEDTQALIGKDIWLPLSYSHPFRGVKIAKVWPNRVIVNFSQPELLISFQPSVAEIKPYSLTNNGYIVSGEGAGLNIPVEDLSLEKLSMEEKVSSRVLQFYHDLLAGLKVTPSFPLNKIIVTSADQVELYLDQNSVAIASENGILRQLASLQAILLSPKIQRVGRVIDLRFENPVIK